MWPVWNGDETEWALDSCLLGHYRYVSFPGVTVRRPKRRQETARSCRPSRSLPQRHQPDQRPGRPAAVPHRELPATCAGFLSIRPRRHRRPAWELMSTRCRQRSTRSAPGRSAQTNSLNIADALQQQVPGVILSDTTGNPFMPDVQFRGFVASPVAGTPQGLAVYQNGMRINEAFGDTVNWDLIPTAAIRSVTVVTNNPAFGLNALGGAVNVLMKDGFNYHGAEINTMGGSFGRIQSSAQYRQADRRLVRLRRARRPARQRISQFFGIGDPALLW